MDVIQPAHQGRVSMITIFTCSFTCYVEEIMALKAVRSRPPVNIFVYSDRQLVHTFYIKSIMPHSM